MMFSRFSFRSNQTNSELHTLDEIDTNLYLGSYREASSVSTLRKYKISHILTINDFPLPPAVQEQLNHLNIKFIRLSDVCSSNLLAHFDATYNFISEGVCEGAVLVHCQMGVSRSATVVVAYIMKKYNLGYRDALDRVERRRMVYPNKGFLSQLESYGDMGCTTIGMYSHKLTKNMMKRVDPNDGSMNEQ